MIRILVEGRLIAELENLKPGEEYQKDVFTIESSPESRRDFIAGVSGPFFGWAKFITGND